MLDLEISPRSKLLQIKNVAFEIAELRFKSIEAGFRKVQYESLDPERNSSKHIRANI